MAGTTESPGASQSGSIIACAVVMFLLAMTAFGLRAYTRFFIVRVASYEELLVGLAVVSSLFVCRGHGQADQDRSQAFSLVSSIGTIQREYRSRFGSMHGTAGRCKSWTYPSSGLNEPQRHNRD